MIQLLQKHKFCANFPVHFVRLNYAVEHFPQFNATIESTSTLLRATDPRDTLLEVIDLIQVDLDILAYLGTVKGYVFAFGSIDSPHTKDRLIVYGKVVMV